MVVKINILNKTQNVQAFILNAKVQNISLLKNFASYAVAKYGTIAGLITAGINMSTAGLLLSGAFVGLITALAMGYFTSRGDTRQVENEIKQIESEIK